MRGQLGNLGAEAGIAARFSSCATRFEPGTRRALDGESAHPNLTTPCPDGQRTTGQSCAQAVYGSGTCSSPLSAKVNRSCVIVNGVKPRAFGDPAWQKSVDDARIAKTIVEGGAAVQLSPAMAANPDLQGKPEVVAELVKIVRKFSD